MKVYDMKRLYPLLEEVKISLEEEKSYQSKKRTAGNSHSSDLGLGGIVDEKRAKMIRLIIEKTDNALEALREEMFLAVLKEKSSQKKVPGLSTFLSLLLSYSL